MSVSDWFDGDHFFRLERQVWWPAWLALLPAWTTCCLIPRKLRAHPPAHLVGLHPSQIGLLSALRPWISAPCGSIVAGLADRWGGHRFVLLFTYVAVTLVQVGPAH